MRNRHRRKPLQHNGFSGALLEGIDIQLRDGRRQHLEAAGAVLVLILRQQAHDLLAMRAVRENEYQRDRLPLILAERRRLAAGQIDADESPT